MTSTKIKRSLFIEARRCHLSGSTYFSARIFVDGGQVALLPFEYGYENHYESVCQAKLMELGWLPALSMNRGLFSIARELGFDYYTSVSDTTKARMFKTYEYYQEVSA